MNDRQTYEDQLNRQWDKLSLPDENMAWSDMRRRLDEEDDDRLLIPPVRKGCGLWALLLAFLLVGLFWFIVRPEKWFVGKDKTPVAESVSDTTSGNEATTPDSRSSNNDESESAVRTTTIDNFDSTSNKIDGNRSIGDRSLHPDSVSNVTVSNKNTVQSSKPSVKVRATSPSQSANNSNGRTKRTESTFTSGTENVRSNLNDRSTTRPKETEDRLNNVRASGKPGDAKKADNNDTTVVRGDKVVTPVAESRMNHDAISAVDSATINKVMKDSIDRTDSTKTPSKEKPVKEKRKIFFTAGVGMHQQIPVAGQESVTYGSLGRQGLLSDYIPSAYFTMEKDRRWFVETGFRYGAPQHNKLTTFSSESSTDSVNGQIVITTNSKQLKKSFYHQLPLSFNYYVLPGWSLGTGVVWNKFHSAVIENTTLRRTFVTPDTVLGKTTYKLGSDSAEFYGIKRSWMQMFFQSQYQWKRFTIGARYSFGIQPYISISLPNAPVQNEKNSSLQVFLKFQLWRSKEQ